MADSYPDIMGEFIDAPQRFETSGLQYAGHFDPAKITPGIVSNLFVFLQNTLNVPMGINLKIEIPKTGGFFRGSKPVLHVKRPIIQIKLAEGEAGLLTLPFITTETYETGNYEVVLEPKIATQVKGERIRPPKSQSKLGKSPLLDSITGLGLVGVLGATYVEESVKKGTFPLEIAGELQVTERAPKLDHAYQTIWTPESIGLLKQAFHEIQLRDARLKEVLNPEALYATLYSETTFRFADAGLPLRIGEAIALAKILTYSCQFFLSQPSRRQGLLVPIWERALDGGMDTGDALQVIRTAGYSHILKLSIAMSFGLIAQAMGRQPWSLEERQGVAEHLTENIEIGENTDEDFLYLPLLMGGTLISGQLTWDGENPKESLALMRKAREARQDLFFDDEMAEANKIYSQILQKAMQLVK